MKLSDFHFDLPDELIARYPEAVRSASRLLQVDARTGRRHHGRFADLPDLLAPGDLLVFNDTRVMPARLFGHLTSGLTDHREISQDGVYGLAITAKTLFIHPPDEESDRLRCIEDIGQSILGSPTRHVRRPRGSLRAFRA